MVYQMALSSFRVWRTVPTLHVAGYDVSAEAAVGRHGPLQVDPAARPEIGQGGAVQSLVHHVGGEGSGGKGGGGQADAIDGDAVADVDVL